MKATSIRVSEATVKKIKKIKEITGLQTYNDVLFFVLSKYYEEPDKKEKKEKRYEKELDRPPI